jgi:hypothetical protein
VRPTVPDSSSPLSSFLLLCVAVQVKEFGWQGIISSNTRKSATDSSLELEVKSIAPVKRRLNFDLDEDVGAYDNLAEELDICDDTCEELRELLVRSRARPSSQCSNDICAEQDSGRFTFRPVGRVGRPASRASRSSPSSTRAPSRGCSSRGRSARPGSAAARSETSLVLLTKRFMEMIRNNAEGVVDLNVTAGSLGVSKRRLYDITNVMEGIAFIHKKSKNQIQWRAAPGDTSESLAALRNAQVPC